MTVLSSDSELESFSDTDDCNDCSSDSSLSDGKNDKDLPKLLCDWAVNRNINQCSFRSLLGILRKFHPALPKDPRTLLSTGKIEGIKTIRGGSYYHFGVAYGIMSKFASDPKLRGGNNKLFLQINVDGLPLFKSSNTQFWPILGLLQGSSEPFIIGLFTGNSKPKDPEEFLNDFVTEMIQLKLNDLTFDGRVYTVNILNFVCDAPARAYLKQVKGHSGYSGCEKCNQRGTYDKKMLFPETDAPHRTDKSFDDTVDGDHHIGPNPLRKLELGMVSQFPLDYMHLVCLGVMRRLLMLWLKGPLKRRLGTQVKTQISQSLLSLCCFIPK